MNIKIITMMSKDTRSFGSSLTDRRLKMLLFIPLHLVFQFKRYKMPSFIGTL
jgi:hypothetical protein